MWISLNETCLFLSLSHKTHNSSKFNFINKVMMKERTSVSIFNLKRIWLYLASVDVVKKLIPHQLCNLGFYYRNLLFYLLVGSLLFKKCTYMRFIKSQHWIVGLNRTVEKNYKLKNDKKRTKKVKQFNQTKNSIFVFMLLNYVVLKLFSNFFL